MSGPDLPRRARARALAVGVLVVAAGLLAGAFANAALRRDADPASVQRYWADLEREHSDSVYDAATVRFGGRLSASATAALAALPFDTTVLVVVRGPDSRTCEDLGRQLRELERAVPARPGWGLAVMVDPQGESIVRGFLRRERVPRARVLIGEPSELLREGRAPATPAALVADREGRFEQGVSHPLRVRDTRTRSFAQELGLHDPRRAPGQQASVGARP